MLLFTYTHGDVKCKRGRKHYKVFSITWNKEEVCVGGNSESHSTGKQTLREHLTYKHVRD